MAPQPPIPQVAHFDSSHRGSLLVVNVRAGSFSFSVSLSQTSRSMIESHGASRRSPLYDASPATAALHRVSFTCSADQGLPQTVDIPASRHCRAMALRLTS